MSSALWKKLAARARARAKARLGPVVRALAPRRVDLPPSRWGLSERDGRLTYEGIDLERLLLRHGSPLHVVLGRRLDENVDRFLAVPSGADRGCEVFYSYKTNPVPGVLRRLHARGVGAEVISPYELWLALRMQVPPEKIVYNGPAKSDASVALAIEKGIALLNLNHREEIARTAAIARSVGRPARIGLRVAPRLGWSGQFGCAIDGGAALDAFEEALRTPGLDVQGVHAHVGVPLDREATLHAFLDEVFAFLDELRSRTGFSPSILDLGGSLSAPCVAPLPRASRLLNRTFLTDLIPPEPDERLSARAYVSAVLRRVERFARARGLPAPRVFLEPGRAMTSDAQLLLARVVSTKEQDGLRWAILDAGVNVAECVQNEYHQLFPVVKKPLPPRVHRIAGPICTPGDVLYPAWEMPMLEPGDALAIMDAGAYFVPFATSFSFPQPGIVVVDGGRARTLRRAESYEDMIGKDAQDEERAAPHERLERVVAAEALAARDPKEPLDAADAAEPLGVAPLVEVLAAAPAPRRGRGASAPRGAR